MLRSLNVRKVARKSLFRFPSFELLEDRFAPATIVWNQTAAGSYTYSNGANWVGGVAPGPGDIASFTNNITGNQTINLTSAVTLQGIVMGDSDNTHAFALTGSPITFNTASGIVKNLGTGTANATPDSIANAIVLGASNTALTNNYLNASLALNGAISGAFSVNKAGSGTVAYGATNSYSGGTTLSAGRLNFGADGQLGASNSGVTFNGGTLRYIGGGGTAITSARAITVNAGGGTIDTSGSVSPNLDRITIAAPINGSSGAVLTLAANGNTADGNIDPGYLEITSSNSATYTGTMTVSSGLVRALETGFGASSSALTITGGGLVGTNNTTLARNIVLSGSGDRIFRTYGPGTSTITLSGVISGTGNLRKTDGGVLVLSGTNTFAGATTISAGILSYSSDANLGNAANGVTLNGGTLRFTGGNGSAGLVALASTRTLTVGAGGGTIDTSASNSPNNDRIFIAAAISGSGPLTLAANGNTADGNIDPGYLEITSNNTATYTGAMTISSGLVSALNIGFGASANALTITGGGLVSGFGAFTVARPIVLSGSGNRIVRVYGSGSLTLSGLISGSANLRKTDFGNLVLTNTNPATGTLIVAGGSLSGSGSFAGPISGLSNGILVPGAGATAIYSTGAANLAGTYGIDLNGATAGTGYDQLNVTGTVALSGGLSLSLGFNPTPGQNFTLIANDGADPVSGTFSGFPEGSVRPIASGPFSGLFQFTYQGGDGNDVVLNAISSTSPVLSGTSGDDVWLVKRNSANVDISLNGTVIYSTAFASLTSLTLNGRAGNDSLTVDLSGGDPLPSGGLTFDGGTSSGSVGNTLSITGGSTQGTTTVSASSSTAGTIAMSNFGNIVFTNVQATANSGALANLVVNLPAGPSSAVLSDDGVTGNSLSRLSVSTMPRLDFKNPSGSLTINRGNAADTLTMNALFDFDQTLTIGTGAQPFSSIIAAGAVTLAVGENLSLAAQTILVSGALVTSGGAIALTATGDITLSNALVTGGGAMNILADSDGDGAGKLTIDAPLAELVDPNPAPGNRFGDTIAVLPNGNVVVTSPFDDAGATDAGAVYLFDGRTGALISTLRGSSANDNVGSSGVTVLANGNYVVSSLFWDNGAATDAGAVTWGSGTSGVSGIVSVANSLVGSSANDNVGNGGVTVLANGNYVVRSSSWDNGAATNAGAVTWGSGTSGVSGLVSVANSLVGSSASDLVGSSGVTVLANGNYVVSSLFWDNGAATNAGAVTWGSGTTGVSGLVSSANSLVGSSAFDNVGIDGVTVLANGNYVVRSSLWNNGAATDAGAVTWGSGTSGVSGLVSSANSLVGSTPNDFVGNSGVTPLSNGNYVVSSRLWNNGTVADAGAVTWGSGTTGIAGLVSSTNSLVGSTAGDQVGSSGVTALSNGNYVVRSPNWDNGTATNAGAVTWGSGTTGIAGVVSSANSLVGSTAGDQVGSGGVTALSNGNYVVSSRLWNNGTVADAGAVTWGDGTTGIAGLVSSANSLVGSTVGDQVGSGVGGSGDVTALSNGNYVVSSPDWDNGTATDAGAVTWGSGTTGIAGVVSGANSLVGSTADDQVGYWGVTALSNGNYVVRIPDWDNGTATNAGAVTWGSGTTGIAGVVSGTNSLVGSAANNVVGSYPTIALSNGNYVVVSPFWDNGTATNVGAVTWGSGTTGVAGVVSGANSLVGSTADDRVGFTDVNPLSNGNYVVVSPFWDNGTATDAGAVTWGSGATGIAGVVSSTNSLVGSTAGDQVGFGLGLTVLPNGNYLALSPFWDNGTATNAGAVTWGSGTTGIAGVVSSANSFVGASAGVGNFLRFTVDNASGRFFAQFPTDGGGRIYSGTQIKGTYGLDAGAGFAALRAGNGIGVAPVLPGVDLKAGSTSFVPGTDLTIALQGTTLDSQYTQLNVAGPVNLTGADLSLTGSYVPLPGDTFTIVSAPNITGLFNGRANGSYFTFNGVQMKIAYTATAVTLSAGFPSPYDVYIDPAFAPLTLGAAIVDADPATPGNQPATFGVNAFANLLGLEAVGPGKTAAVAAGTYSQSPVLTSSFNLRVASGTVTLNGILSGSGGFTKTGNGTLTLGGANTFTGGLYANRGKVQVASNSNLGGNGNIVGANAPGELVITASMSSDKIFDLGDGTLTVNNGVTLTLTSGEIDGGFLRGPGSIATTAGQSAGFYGSTIQNSMTILANGSDSFTNVSNSGSITIGAGQTASLSGFCNEAAGRLTINGAAALSDFTTYGQLTVAATGSVTNPGSTGLVFGGGSVTTINLGGTLNTGAVDARVAGGLVTNYGNFGANTNQVVVDYGGRVQGPGTFHSVITQNGGVYSPGNSPGPATMDTFPINGGGTFDFEIANAAGTPGSVNGWDMTTVAPTIFSPAAAAINITATAANKYNILIDSKLNDGIGKTAGPAANFNPNQNYAWKFLDGSHAATTVTGVFDPAAFNIVASDFQNAFTGTFSVQLRDGGKNLYVVYTAPAPTIISIAPFSGPTAGGTIVVITGTNFSGATAVTFGVNAATSFTVNSASQITATAPAGTGTVHVTVTTPSGSTASSPASQFTYKSPPVLVSTVVNGATPELLNLPTAFVNQRSMVRSIAFTFDSPVILTPNAVVLSIHPNPAIVAPTLPGVVSVTNSTGGTGLDTVWKITFSGANVVGGSIADGEYNLNILANQVTDEFGQPLASAPAPFRFYRLFGDADGNRTVNNIDIVNVRRRANTTQAAPGYLWLFDSDWNGTISTADIVLVRRRANIAL